MRRQTCPRARTPLILCAAVLLCSRTIAQRSQSGEDSVKAAFLYNFTKFIDWPESAFSGASPRFTVCVFAGDAFRHELEAIMQGEQVRGRPVIVESPDQAAGLKGCHLVYFGPEQGERAGKQLAAVRQIPVLTVGEGDRFLEQGGLIAFKLVNDRVRFDISKRAADAAGLNVSSKLLRVARQVDGTIP